MFGTRYVIFRDLDVKARGGCTSGHSDDVAKIKYYLILATSSECALPNPPLQPSKRLPKKTGCNWLPTGLLVLGQKARTETVGSRISKNRQPKSGCNRCRSGPVAVFLASPQPDFKTLLLKPPDGVGFEWCLHDTVSSKPFPSVERHSPKPLVVFIPLVPKPVSTRAYSCRIRNTTVASKRRNNSVVNTTIALSAYKRLPSSEAPSLPLSSSADTLQMPNLHHANLELAARVLKPPIRMAYQQFLYEAVSLLSKWTGLATYLCGPSITRNATSCRPLCTSLRWTSDRGREVSCRLRLLVAVFGQLNC